MRMHVFVHLFKFQRSFVNHVRELFTCALKCLEPHNKKSIGDLVCRRLDFGVRVWRSIIDFESSPQNSQLLC
ncbi:hypothetical protein VNO80_04305 [Phaseolus coccineus]|uniref:Uncharacterized protein n=1 Tax=Phaseolus coccineus TaxID=3886 RepID=A0AAN9RP89_PHACN